MAASIEEVDELKAVLVDIWENLSLVTINSLIVQILARLSEVIAHNRHDSPVMESKRSPAIENN
jgi:hypothetical protein